MKNIAYDDKDLPLPIKDALLKLFDTRWNQVAVVREQYSNDYSKYIKAFSKKPYTTHDLMLELKAYDLYNSVYKDLLPFIFNGVEIK